jgi:glycosyltransferase involved in cell wall biosynthesis
MTVHPPKKRLKILYVITKSNFGGAQRYVYDLATSLSPLSYEVVVAMGSGGTLEDMLKHAQIRTVRIHSLQRDLNIFKDISVLLELIKLFRKERPDVVHLNSSKIGGLGGLAGRIVGIKKIIFTGHGWAFNEDRSFISRKLITIAHWLTVILSHTTIAVAHSVARQIETMPLLQSRVRVIHNGIIPRHFDEKTKARHILASHHKTLATRHSKVEQGFWIGTISELHPNKGLDFLITAFSRIAEFYADINLVIIGEGEDRKKLEHTIKKLNLSDRVFLLGFIPDASTYLRAFDIFMLTSRTEALPYVLLEAGSASLPAIASAVGGIPEILTHQQTGILTKPKDVQSIVGAILELIKHPEEQERFGTALQQKIATEFTIDEMCEKTLALYMSASPTPGPLHRSQ